MARKDTEAGDLVRRMAIGRGHSPESLVRAIRDQGVKDGYPATRVSVSSDTIYLVYKGHQPGPRIKFAIANYFDLLPGQIWKDDAVVLDTTDAARHQVPA